MHALQVQLEVALKMVADVHAERQAPRAGRPRRGRGGKKRTFALVLLHVMLALSVSPVRVLAVDECTISSTTLPCAFGGCIFSDAGGGVVQRQGSCRCDGDSSDLRAIFLSNKGITALSANVFNGMGECT